MRGGGESNSLVSVNFNYYSIHIHLIFNSYSLLASHHPVNCETICTAKFHATCDISPRCPSHGLQLEHWSLEGPHINDHSQHGFKLLRPGVLCSATRIRTLKQLLSLVNCQQRTEWIINPTNFRATKKIFYIKSIFDFCEECRRPDIAVSNYKQSIFRNLIGFQFWCILTFLSQGRVPEYLSPKLT